MLRQYPLLRATLFAITYTVLITFADFFQDKAWQDEVWRNATVSLFTGGLLYLWQFRKVAKNDRLAP